MPHTIRCPSGLTGTIRGLKVREERVLADRKIAKAGGVVDELLRACWEETEDYGLYSFDAGKTDWDKVLQGDRFFALLQIRALTYGPDYAFAITYREDACRARIEWELDLDHLPVRPLCGESRDAFLAGSRIETRLPDAGHRVWFRLLTGADERKQLLGVESYLDRFFAKEQSDDADIFSTIAYRVVDGDTLFNLAGPLLRAAAARVRILVGDR